MRKFSWQLYGNPIEIVKAIGNVAFSLRCPFFKYPAIDDSTFDYDRNYTDVLDTYKTAEQLIEALEPQGSGWNLYYNRIGIFSPIKWKRTSLDPGTHSEIVGYLDFAPGPNENQPSILEIVDIESESDFLDTLVVNLNKAFERSSFLKSATAFKMQHTPMKHSDISVENKDLFRELRELNRQLHEITQLRRRVEELEQEAKNNEEKKKELDSLRDEIAPASHRLSSGKISIYEERINALLQTQRIYYRDLNEMEKRAAYNGLNVPIDVVNQIEYYNSLTYTPTN